MAFQHRPLSFAESAISRRNAFFWRQPVRIARAAVM
jgi:hypothetical protein